MYPAYRKDEKLIGAKTRGADNDDDTSHVPLLCRTWKMIPHR